MTWHGRGMAWHGMFVFCLFGLRLYVPVNNFSVMSGRSHRFLGITSTFWEVNVSCSRIQQGDPSEDRMAWYGMGNGKARNGRDMVWHVMVRLWYGKTWHGRGKVWHGRGMAWHGRDMLLHGMIGV